MAVRTSTLVQGRGPLKVRNRHLIPEASTRGRRIMLSAAEEEHSAVQFYTNTVEYWKRLFHGRKCSCTNETVQSTKESLENTGTVSLKDFIYSDTLLPTQDFCPICLGYKFVGGYQKYGTTQIVLDSTLGPRLNKINAINDAPTWYKPTSSLGTLTWTVQLPLHFISVGDICIKWKEIPSHWDLKIDGTSLTSDLLYASRGLKVVFSLEMKDGSNDNAGLYGIFIQLNDKNTDIKIDIPNQELVYGQGDFGTIDSVQGEITANIDRTLEDVNTTDLFVDKKGVIWRVVGANKTDVFDTVVFSTLSCRKVQAFENYYIMPSLKIHNIYHASNTNHCVMSFL